MTVRRPVLRYHGAKFRLAPWIVAKFPAHAVYVEPYGGAAGVMLSKPRSYAEVYNDLDGNVVNFFRVLRDPVLRAALVEQCYLTPYVREEFELAWQTSDDPVESARRLCVRAQMGFGSAGATKGATGFRIDTRRKYGTAQHAWTQYPSIVAELGERFVGVMIENRNALEVMATHDADDTLHYVDPPYVHSTRCMGMGKKAYRHEMTDAEHIELLTFLRTLRGVVVLSGYRSPIYDELLQGWQLHETRARISAGRGTELRTEALWISPNGHTRDLFG